MTAPTFPDLYPPARWKGDGKVYGSFLAGSRPRIVWHTTETVGLPSYDTDGDPEAEIAPHLTYDPKTRLWVQHSPLSGSIGALRDETGGTRTNRQSALQVEIICYSAKSVADRSVNRLWVGDLTIENLADLAEFGVFGFRDWGVPLELHPLTMLYTDSRAYGADSASRMSVVDWESRTSNGNEWGWCAHRNVPENTHWDTGALDLPTMLTLAREALIVATFADVPPDHRFSTEIEWLAEAGITRGKSEDDPSTPGNEATFAPNDPVTRGQMAAFLYRGLYLTGLLDIHGDKA